MDQVALMENEINIRLPAMSIQGAGETPKIKQLTLYKQPGYSTKNLNLLELMQKPVYLPAITIDSSFTRWDYLIDPSIFQVNQWAVFYTNNFPSVRFDVELIFVVTGHQFAILKLALCYMPNKITTSELFYPSSHYVLVPFPPSSTTQEKYNRARSLNSTFFGLSDSTQTISHVANLPTNYPMNPFVNETLSLPPFGGFSLVPITPIRFGMSVTSITIRPMIRLTDVSLMPWKA